METMETQTAIRLAKKLVGRLPKKMADELKILIVHGEDEHYDPITEISELLTQHENSLLWFLEQMELQSGQRGGHREFNPLPGDSFAPISDKWICPKDNCIETQPVIQEGEPAPECVEHKIEMVREYK
jgi:hypothetical protein